MSSLVVHPVLRSKAEAAGATGWLRDLPGIIAGLEQDWSITVGRPFDSSTEAFVAEATLADGTPAVLKLSIPRPGDHARHEITVLRLTRPPVLGPRRRVRADLRRAAGRGPRRPDGLLAEAEYDLGIIMREDPVELLHGDPRERSRWLAWRCGLDETAIWAWGAVERVSTGLLCTRIGLQPVGAEMLAAADQVAVLPAG